MRAEAVFRLAGKRRDERPVHCGASAGVHLVPVQTGLEVADDQRGLLFADEVLPGSAAPGLGRQTHSAAAQGTQPSAAAGRRRGQEADRKRRDIQTPGIHVVAIRHGAAAGRSVEPAAGAHRRGAPAGARGQGQRGEGPVRGVAGMPAAPAAAILQGLPPAGLSVQRQSERRALGETLGAMVYPACAQYGGN